MVYKKARKGAQGIGTLIIFIALILVAAVAAGVLISTVGKLQGKAETTGTQVQQRLGTGFTVFEVVANNTNDSMINASKDTIATSLQLSPGSSAVKLSDISLTLVTNSGEYSYTYSGGTSYNTTTFGVSYLKPAVLNGYISNGDTVKLSIISGANIGENQQFTIRLFPGTGNPLPVDIVTPASMVNTFTVLK